MCLILYITTSQHAWNWQNMTRPSKMSQTSRIFLTSRYIELLPEILFVSYCSFMKQNYVTLQQKVIFMRAFQSPKALRTLVSYQNSFLTRAELTCDTFRLIRSHIQHYQHKYDHGLLRKPAAQFSVSCHDILIFSFPHMAYYKLHTG